MEYRINPNTPIRINLLNRRIRMKLREFLIQFAETHSVQHINDIQKGTIKRRIGNEIYLVDNTEVTE